MINKEFQNYSTNTAFNLQLSKCMVSYLVLITVNQEILMSSFITHEHALRRRGLMCRVPYTGDIPFKDLSDCSSPALTKEGRLVVELLKSAGLYDLVLDEYNF